MEVLKRGSKGPAVRQLQRLLMVNADGIFGKATEAAVIDFQKRNGLVADGIVGKATWAALGMSDSDEINIIDGHINKHITPLLNRQIKYIAVHYTAGTTSRKGTALATRNAFLSRDASADFVVDDEQIVQINPDLKNYYCWSVGDPKNPYSGGGRLYKQATNKNVVSVEICSNLFHGTSAKYANHSGWYFTDASLDNAIRIIRYLMKKYNIPKENVVRHYDVSGKLCPGILGWNDAVIYDVNGKATTQKNNSDEWKAFWNKI